MRITHQMLSRNYVNRMNNNLTQLTSSNEKMSSQRAYNKSWENVKDAGKALKVRVLLADNERQQATVKDAQGRATAAESGLRTVNELLIRAEDRLVEGLNGTMAPEDREKIATELEKYQEEILQIMNSQFSGKFLYGASGNANKTAPFYADDAGNLMYNGYAVDSLSKNASGEIVSYDPGIPGYAAIKWNADNYVDVGFGYRLTDDGKVDPNTAFKDTYSGVESFGFGTNADGVPKNAYSLFGKMVENLRANNMDALGKNLNAISDSMESLLTSITEIGARSSVLEDALSRLESDYITLAESQNELEGLDLAEEIIYNKSYEMGWMVTLQLGSKVLPQSIFDFIR